MAQIEIAESRGIDTDPYRVCIADTSRPSREREGRRRTPMHARTCMSMHAQKTTREKQSSAVEVERSKCLSTVHDVLLPSALRQLRCGAFAQRESFDNIQVLHLGLHPSLGTC